MDELDALADQVSARSSARRFYRMLQIIISGTPLLVIPPLVTRARHGVVVPVATVVAVCLFVAVMFQWRLLAIRRDARRVAANLHAIGGALVEQPEPIAGARGGIAVLASNPRFARQVARRSVRFAAAGTWRGTRIEYGAAVVALRDFDVTLSHVKVVAADLPALRVMSRGILTSMSRWLRDKHPVATGDAAFDSAWVVDADEAVARDRLTPAVRAQLVELRSALISTQTASIEAIDGGLVVRWPGALTAALAARLRDVALAIATRGRVDAASR
jgi:hypothetical protein